MHELWQEKTHMNKNGRSQKTPSTTNHLMGENA